MLHTLFPHVREISRGKTNNLHSMYPHHLHPNVRVVLGLRFVLQAHPHRVCLMMFVFLGSELCRQLPSDSPSRRTPLLLANGWQLQTPITDFHRQVIRHARHTIEKGCPFRQPFSTSLFRISITTLSFLLYRNACFSLCQVHHYRCSNEDRRIST